MGSDERIHAETCARYDAFELPPDFRALPMVLEGYSLGGRLGARYVHVRNAEVGCFMARVEGHAAP